MLVLNHGQERAVGDRVYSVVVDFKPTMEGIRSALGASQSHVHDGRECFDVEADGE